MIRQYIKDKCTEDGDHNNFAIHWMNAIRNETDGQKPRALVYSWIYQAYAAGHDKISDG